MMWWLFISYLLIGASIATYAARAYLHSRMLKSLDWGGQVAWIATAVAWPLFLLATLTVAIWHHRHQRHQ